MGNTQLVVQPHIYVYVKFIWIELYKRSIIESLQLKITVLRIVSQRKYLALIDFISSYFYRQFISSHD